MQTLRRTPLYERHAALGARLVPFAGWEMPVQYTSIIEEHRAVRTAAGVFDVSHMGQLQLAEQGAHDYLQGRLSNDLDRIGPAVDWQREGRFAQVPEINTVHGRAKRCTGRDHLERVCSNARGHLVRSHGHRFLPYRRYEAE